MRKDTRILNPILFGSGIRKRVPKENVLREKIFNRLHYIWPENLVMKNILLTSWQRRHSVLMKPSATSIERPDSSINNDESCCVL